MLLGSLSACYDDAKDADDFQTYQGPVSEVTDAEILYSDSAMVRMKLTAPYMLTFESGDQDFPEGVYIESFEGEGVKTSTIKADRGNFNQADNKYTAEGNVVVENLESGETLRTELLYWEPRDNKIHTDRYVEIASEEEVIMGEGLTSNEDFSSYSILKPTGSFSVK